MIKNLVPYEIRMHLMVEESDYLDQIFNQFGGFPNLEELWQLMDDQWDALKCDPTQMDERVTAYYRHPVWMLNGLFVEHDAESLSNRRAFTDWIVKQAPARIADIGGGFGGLARFVGQALPTTQVEVIEPHPRSVAIAMAFDTPNVRFVPELIGEYDMLVCTDVFEHVPDPLAICAETASHLKVGGHYLIANCFAPVMKCHLPQLFYFEYGWDFSMEAMGLIPESHVAYGRAYQRVASINLPAARKKGEYARQIYPFIRHLPRGRIRVGKLAMNIIAKIL